MNSYVLKEKNMLCGSACLHYISNVENSFNAFVFPDMEWITELAAFLGNNCKIPFTLSCYNSNLYSDFVKGVLPHDFIGYKKLKEYTINHPKILELKPSIEMFDDTSKIYILNVSSKIIFNDNSLNGGHYIAIVGKTNNDFIVVNPGSTKIFLTTLNKNLVLNANLSFGGWVIHISKKEVPFRKF